MKNNKINKRKKKMSLDNQYFERIHNEQSTNKKMVYHVFKPTYPAVVLFSGSGEPLASLQLNCFDKDTKSCLTARPKLQSQSYDAKNINSKCDFQGILTKEGKEFELIMTNFTKDRINFNIFLQDTKTLKANPGGINQINVLTGYQSISVKSDQNKDNAALILEAVKKFIGTGEEKKVTVKEAELEEKSEANYLFLSVVPQLGKEELKKLFTKTIWKCADVIVIKEKVKEYNNELYGRNNYYRTERLGVDQSLNFNENERSDLVHRPTSTRSSRLEGLIQQSEKLNSNAQYSRSTSISQLLDQSEEIDERLTSIREMSKTLSDVEIGEMHDNIETHEEEKIHLEGMSGPKQFCSRSKSSNTSLFSSLFKSNSTQVNTRSPNDSNIDGMAMPRSSSSSFFGSIFKPSNNTNTNTNTNTMSSNVSSNDTNKSFFGSIFKSKNSTESIPRSPTAESSQDSSSQSMFGKFKQNLFGNKNNNNNNDQNMQQVIEDSYVGKIGYGKKVQVSSVESEAEFDYDLPAAPCVIGLSISDKIVFRTIDLEEYIEIAKEVIKDILENENRSLIESLDKVFVAEQCCICLDEEDKKLDAIFYNCGHQCCHKQCSQDLKKCPLCRSIITAQILIK